MDLSAAIGNGNVNVLRQNKYSACYVNNTIDNTIELLLAFRDNVDNAPHPFEISTIAFDWHL